MTNPPESEEQKWRDCVIADFKNHRSQIRSLEFHVIVLSAALAFYAFKDLV